MNKQHTYNLLSNIISLINSEEYDSSITNLSYDCNIPLPYMRKLFISLLNNKILGSCLLVRDDYDINDNEQTHIEEFINDSPTFEQKILNGDYDSLIWDISLNILDYKEHELLPLSPLEYGAIKSLGENVLSIKHSSLFEKKDIINPLSIFTRKNQQLMQDAINNRQAISFTYKNKENLLEHVTCFPDELITNVSDNWLYLSSTDGKLYRLDRVVQICKIIKSNKNYPKPEKYPNQKYVWGAFRNKELSPIHVILRISPETPNIISKIKADTAFRSRTCQLYQDGSYYYYEDDIIGLSEFQRWIRSYGSSIIVLEPSSLQNEIVERAHQTLQYYELAKNWNDL